jgi:hypothetical protein
MPPSWRMRAAFLAGEGTLTVREVQEWAAEYRAAVGSIHSLPYGMLDNQPVMVSVLPVGVNLPRTTP